jgi:2-polyprenyl-3-methyl-5-hydroxy-6-metoxy-1,4-benzoquinol methylase
VKGAGTVKKETLGDFVERTDQLGGPDAEQAVRYWQDFSYQPQVTIDQSLDPLSDEYFQQQLNLYRELADRELDQNENELTEFDLRASIEGANPYGRQSPKFLAEHARAVCEAIALGDLAEAPSVLDMGSGWGLSSELLAFTGCVVTAVDINHQFVELVRRRSDRLGLNIQAVHSSFDEFNTDRRFDAIFFYECLHHATKPWELLRRCTTWLKEGGKLIISGEPINDIWWKHWGLRLDALSVYCIRKFGWFESGWSLPFLKRIVVEAGLWPTVFEGKGLGAAGVVVARKPKEDEAYERIVELTASLGAVRMERDCLVEERVALKYERDRLVEEGVALKQERDALREERDAIFRSRSWRMTGPLRWVSGKLHHA